MGVGGGAFSGIWKGFYRVSRGGQGVISVTLHQREGLSM